MNELVCAARRFAAGAVCAVSLCSGIARAGDLDVVINEILHHPPVGLEDAEFIELYNRSAATVDLGGWRFDSPVTITLPAGTTIAPRGYLLVVRDLALAASLYAGVDLAGNTSGRLDDAGGRLRLRNAAGVIVQEFDTPGGEAPPESAAGTGRSLEKLSPEREPWFADSWAPSVTLLGSPGKLNTQFRELVDLALVAVGEDASYFKGTAEPSAAAGEWAQPGFDDSTWLAGPTGIGYGDGDDATVLDDMQNGYSSLYLRRRFDVADPAKVEALTLVIDYDDGFAAYLNGFEVARRNAGGTPGTPLPFDALAPANHDAGVPEEIDLSSSIPLLVSGTNVLAFQGVNTTLASSDFSLAPALRAAVAVVGTETSLNRIVGSTAVPREAAWSFFRGAAEPAATLGDWTLPGFDDTAWESGPAGFGYGDGDDNTVLADMQNGYRTVYLRRVFTVSDPASLAGMTLGVDYDDAFIAYLNGVEVARSAGAPGNPGEFQAHDALSTLSHEAGTEETFDLGAFLGDLVAGDNALALQGFNASLGSGDFSLHPRLTLLRSVAGDPDAILACLKINEVLAPGDGTGFVELWGGCSDPVDLSGFGLSADASDPLRYTFPGGSVVPAGGFLAVSEADLGFALPPVATLVLVDGAGVVLVDGLRYEIVDPALPAGRFPDGASALWTLEAASAGTANASPPEWGVVINEIMYHPAGDPAAAELEWLELHNPTGSPVDLAGWRLEGAIDLDLPPGTVIPAGGYLVVARDPPAVEAAYGISGVAGSFTGDLANDDGLLVLRDHLDNVADRVRYADDGRWPAAADGTGPSLELVNPALDNANGQAWRASAGSGTPGAQNSQYATSAPPLVSGLIHSPAVPGDGQSVQVTLAAAGLDPIAEVRLFYRAAAAAGSPPDPFTQVLLLDDGASGDGAAGDGVHGGSIPGQPLGTVVEFFVEAEDTAGNVQVVPAAAPGRCHLYIVDTQPDPLGVPRYRLVMTPQERFELESRDLFSDELLGGTFITDREVFYGRGVRYRGKTARLASPKSYRVEFTDDEPFAGRTALELAGNGPHEQHLGMAAFRGAGVPASLTRIVRFVLNDDADLTYLEMEAVDEDFLRRTYAAPPGESEGNLYQALGDGDLDYRGPDPDAYRPSYEKVTNEELDDWSDLIDLCDVLTNTPEAELEAVLPGLIDVDEWVRFFAVHTLLSTQEQGIYRDQGDDYFLYRRPGDGRWVIIPWDLDDSFRLPAEALFRPALFQVRRILEHPAWTPSYFQHLVALGATHLSSERVASELALLEGLVPPGDLDLLQSFVDARLQFVDSRINEEFTVTLQPETLVARGVPWRFFRGTAEPAGGTLDWTAPGFDDSSWEVGPTGIGYGDGDDATLLADMQNGYTTVYARHEFTVADPAAFPVLELAVDYDDGCVAFLNGVEVARANAGPAGTYPAFDSLASGLREAGSFQVFDIDAGSLLVAGSNVLALVGLNATIDSTDFSLIPELRTGGVVGEGCPGDFLVTGATLNLSGLAPVTQTRHVRVNGTDAAYDPKTGEWAHSEPLLGPGAAVTVEALAPDLSVVASEALTVTRVHTVAGTLGEDTTWRAAESPYVVVGSVAVPAGVRLEIEAGCQFWVEEGVGFTIRGEIQALGTEGASIVFTRLPCHGNWGYFDIQSQASNLFSYTELSRSTGNPGCLTARSSNLELNHCHIHDIAGEGVNAGGGTSRIRNTIVERTNEALSLDFGNTVVEFCTLRNVIGKSDLCDANGSNNPPARIAYCTMYGTSDDGIDADRGSVFAEGNLIRNCGDQTISLVGSGNSTVQRNVLRNSSHGISVKDRHVCLATFNTVVNNSVTGVRGIEKTAGQGGGIVTLKNSILWGNGTPLFVSSTGVITTTYSDVQGELVPGEGNINADPLFADPGANDFRLQAGSPCIGAAENGDDMGALPFETVPRAPSDLRVTAVRSDTIALGWTDNSFAEDGFELERRASSGFVPEVMVAAGDSWQFFRGRSEPAAGTLDWTAVGFDDSGWETGPTGIGYGDGDDATVLGDMQNRYSTVYLRHVFNLPDPGAFQTLELVIDFDDAFVAYLNGVEIARQFAGLPGTLLPFDSFAAGQHEAGEAVSVEFSTEGILQAGDNVLAIQGLNATLSSSDLSLIPVLRSTDPAPFVLHAVLPANTWSFTDGGLTAATIYSYRLRAFNTSGLSAYSNIVTQETADIPEAPSDLMVTAVDRESISLAWTDNSDVEETFELERAVADGEFELLASLPANTTSFDDMGLAEGETYHYRLRAANAFGKSPYSNTVTQEARVPPAAPSELAVTGIFVDAISMVWTDNADNETGFEVQARFGATGEFQQRAILPADTTRYLDSDLDPGTRLTYRVRALNAIGASGFSNEVTAETGRLPAAPSDLTVTGVGLDFVSLSWIDEADNESAFELERLGPGDAEFQPLVTLPTGTTSYTDLGLEAGTVYRYRLRAVNEFGPSPYTLETAAETARLPAAPSGLHVTGFGLDWVDLAWTDNADNESRFELERRQGAGIFVKVADLPADTEAHTDLGLGEGTEYFYRLRAVSPFGASGYSEEVAVTTGRLPAPPTGLELLSRTHQSVTISWTDNADNETGYEVDRSDAGGPFATVAQLAQGATVYSDTGLAQETEYRYVVRAVNEFGSSDPSEVLAAVTGRLPSAPADLTVIAVGLMEIELSWVDTADNETGFELERRQGAGAFVKVADPPADSESYLDTDLAQGTEYSYRLRAVNEFGASEYTGPVTVVTAHLPAPPADLRLVEATQTSLEIGWTDLADNETAYEVERRGSGESGFFQLAVLPADSSTYLDSGLEPGAAYEYRVRAVNELGVSEYTGPLVAETLSADPVILSIEPAEGPASGGTPVVITGESFISGTEVTVGGVALENLVLASPTEIQGTTPAAAARGAADVAVTTPTGSAVLAGGFTYFDEFLRGDADGDGARNLTDAVVILRWLFAGGRAPPCEEVARVNAGEIVDLSDAVFLLNFLFRGGQAPAPDTARCY